MASPKDIRLLALDVDGVLTDGSILLDDHGVETKRFSVRDGQGITAWIKMGFEVAIITRRSGQALQHRCRELGITRIVQGCQDKSAALDQLIVESGIPANQIAYIGDDWPDMPPLRRVGFPIAPADADPRVQRLAALITTARGGHGAVREVIEHILASKGLLEKTISMYDQPG
jgi:3-deoxy-D-manno-octulosonate 8-phosphate phosphatase (KDO 8-P phosphatase)